jgi:hypothetical protein
MRISDFSRYAVCTCAAAALVSGCEGSQPSIGATGAMLQSSAAVQHAALGRNNSLAGYELRPPGFLPITRLFAKAIGSSGDGRSWVNPAAKNGDLLYVADGGSNRVTVYSYPKGKLVGTLTGFDFPYAECADQGGNVFITNYEGQNIVEYAHGGTKSIATLSDSGYNPIACSVDPSTGNLAVSNNYGSPSVGNIAIYQGARGKPTTYTDPNLYSYFFCGYDNKGDLFVDGQPTASGGFALVELPSGRSTSKNITLSQSIGFPGDVQWTGKDLAVGDQNPYSNEIYQFKISGNKGTEIGSTSLTGPYDVVWFWIQGSSVMANGDNESDTDMVDIWNYPAGGSATQTITKSVSYPEGVTVSVSK